MWFLFKKFISKIFFSMAILFYMTGSFLDTIGVKILMGYSWKESKETVFKEIKRVFNSVK